MGRSTSDHTHQDRPHPDRVPVRRLRLAPVIASHTGHPWGAGNHDRCKPPAGRAAACRTHSDRCAGCAQWRYALIGCGRFGRFCLERLGGWERVRAVAATDLVPSLAEEAARLGRLQGAAMNEARFFRQ